MENKKYQIGIVLLALLLAGAGFGYYWYKDSLFKSYTSTGGNENDYGLNIDGTGEYDIKEVPMDTGVPQPNLDRSITVPASYPKEAKDIFTAQINASIAELKKNPSSYPVWLNLAIQRKSIEDYVGAREIWEYLVAVTPTDFTAHANLANHYAYYEKNAAKAEMHYKTAISLEPGNTNLYRSFSDFYLNLMNDKVKAKAVLQQGITANPQTSQDLKTLLEKL
jgi:tetratricopeptide (TPR) repeat protein